MLLDRVCTQCERRKPAAEFSWKGRDHKRLASRCHACRRANHRENPEANRKRALAYHYANREVIAVKQRQRRVSFGGARLVGEAKKRAAARGLPFDLTAGDISIPKFCPILGMRLVVNEGKCGPDSPSLDRIIPALGYVKGNVVVISHRANTIKSDATMEEIAAVLAFYLSTYGIKSHAWAALAVAATALNIQPNRRAA